MKTRMGGGRGGRGVISVNADIKWFLFKVIDTEKTASLTVIPLNSAFRNILASLYCCIIRMFNPSRPLCSLLPLRLEACSPHKHSLERLNLIFTTVSSLAKETLKPSNTVANDFNNSVVKLGCWPMQSCTDTICPRLSNKRTAEY